MVALYVNFKNFLSMCIGSSNSSNNKRMSNQLWGEKFDRSSMFRKVRPHVPMFPRLALAALLGLNELAKQV